MKSMVNSSSKQQVSKQTPLQYANMMAMKEDMVWGMIRRQAKNDPILQSMLDEVIMWWTLKYDNDSSSKEKW